MRKRRKVPITATLRPAVLKELDKQADLELLNRNEMIEKAFIFYQERINDNAVNKRF